MGIIAQGQGCPQQAEIQEGLDQGCHAPCRPHRQITETFACQKGSEGPSQEGLNKYLLIVFYFDGNKLITAFLIAAACSLASASAAASPRAPATLRYLARLRAAISSASSICFL